MADMNDEPMVQNEEEEIDDPVYFFSQSSKSNYY